MKIGHSRESSSEHPLRRGSALPGQPAAAVRRGSAADGVGGDRPRLALLGLVRVGIGLRRQLAAPVGAGDQLVGRRLPFGMKPDFIPK